MPDVPEYQALCPPGGELCDLLLDPTCPPIVHAEAKVLLEGPYASGAMHAGQEFMDHCPSAQPYSDACFDGTPLDYDSPDCRTIAARFGDRLGAGKPPAGGNC